MLIISTAKVTFFSISATFFSSHFSPFNFQFFSSPLSYLSNLSSLSNPSPTLPIPIPNAPSPPLHGNRAKGGAHQCFPFLSVRREKASMAPSVASTEKIPDFNLGAYVAMLQRGGGGAAVAVAGVLCRV